MKIKARVASYATKEIDVEFPLYVKYGDAFDSGGWYDTYRRYAADGTSHKVTEHDDHWEFEHQPHRQTMSGGGIAASLGHHLIEHDHRCTAEEFYAALDKMIVALNGVPR